MKPIFLVGAVLLGLAASTRGQGADKPPEYVKPDRFEESEHTIGLDDWKLGATLSLPKGGGPFPAVVLVHGSGPHDRDEKIGPNRPFRDLAGGLASEGIAVLRYEKRTKAHGGRTVKMIDTFTVKEEVLDDALAAAAFLRKTSKIDPKKIFIAGHSMGANLAPKLGVLDPSLAGLVLLAGNARTLADVMLEQFDYLGSLPPNQSEAAKKVLAKMKTQAERMKTLTADSPKDELPFGLPARYWISLRDNEPDKVLAGLKQPLLILQGERDYQVTMADFKLWKQLLAKRTNVTFKSYPRLNHLFIAGEGKKSQPLEYYRAGHVDGEVIADVVRWIKEQR
jgi:dienelactone hydrolase